MQKDSVARETFQGVTRGMNDLLDPAFLDKGQAARLLNVVVRNGLAESRPALVGHACPAQGRFQGAFAYELEGNVRWVFVVSGDVWTYSFATNTWLKIASFPTVDFPQAFFCQAGRYCVVQNGVYEPVENWPIIFHGDELVDNLETEYLSGNAVAKVGDYAYDNPTGLPRDADAIRVPIGKAMAFGQGRLFVAVERYWDNGLAGVMGWRYDGLRHILASDDEGADDPARMLVFSQNDRLRGGGALAAPTEAGFITSMAFMRNAATGTGLGELVVMCRRGSVAFAVAVARDEWGANGFGQHLFQTSGSPSPWGMAAVNSDLVYRGDDGLRTLKYTVSNETASGGLAVLPLSPEISGLMSRTSAGHLPYVSVAVSDNYLFLTSDGMSLPTGDVAFRDVLPWDLANFQASGEQSPRVFAGAWRGPLYHAVLRVSPTQYGAAYRETETGPLMYGLFSSVARDAAQVSAVRTGAYSYGAPFTSKRFKYADLMFDRVRTDLEVKVRWRADDNGWHESDVRRFASLGSGSTGPFRVPVEMDNAGTGYFVEFAVEWRGHARLKLAVFSAAIAEVFTGGEDALCATVDLDSQINPGQSSSPEE